MNRKKPKRKPTGRGSRSPRPDAVERPQRQLDPSVRPSSGTTALPKAWVRTWLSIWVCFHLLAVLISFTSVVEPSTVHARLSALVHPYLRPAHFSADDRPVYLTHGEPSEQPHRLQLTTAALTDLDSLDPEQWRGDEALPLGYPGLSISDRVARWLSTAAMLTENEQPSLVAELLLPIAQQNPNATAIRIVRLPTDLSDINAEVETHYVARVVRSGDLVSLVQLHPARLSAKAARMKPESETQEIDPGQEEPRNE